MAAPAPLFDAVFRAGRAVIDGAVSAAEIGVRQGVVLAVAPLSSRSKNFVWAAT